MIIFEKWWHKGNKVVCFSYYKSWEKPEFKIFTNGAKKKNGDTCFDFNIHFGKLAFWYTNYDLQRKIKGDKRKMNCKDCCYNLPKDGHSYCTYEDGECVKISVLEKENADLKNKLEHRNCLDCSNHSSNLRMRTLELEKENAELRAKYLQATDDGTSWAHLKNLENEPENIPYPLGTIFYQYPRIKNPNELFPKTLWEYRGKVQGIPVWLRVK